MATTYYAVSRKSLSSVGGKPIGGTRTKITNTSFVEISAHQFAMGKKDPNLTIVRDVDATQTIYGGTDEYGRDWFVSLPS